MVPCGWLGRGSGWPGNSTKVENALAATSHLIQVSGLDVKRAALVAERGVPAAVGQDDEAHHSSFAQNEQFGDGLIGSLDHRPALYLAGVFLQLRQRRLFRVGQRHMARQLLRETACCHQLTFLQKIVVTMAKRPFRLLAAFSASALNSINSWSGPAILLPARRRHVGAHLTRLARRAFAAINPVRWTALIFAAATR